MTRNSREHPRSRVVVLDPCHHSQEFDQPWPKLGDAISCKRCSYATRTVVEICDSYKARCATKGCRYSRTYGVDKEAAVEAAARHAVAKSSHTVEVSRNEKVEQIVCVQGDQLPLAFLGAATEARKSALRQHHQGLRDFLERHEDF